MKKKMFLSILAMIFFCFLVFIPQVQAQGVLKIGGLMTTSGPAAHLGQVCLNGIMLKAGEINAKGGITVAGKKYKIGFINYDDKCVAKDAVSATERLVRNDKVPLIIGAICSHSTLAAMEITEREKIPLLTPISASMKITSLGYKFIFRTGSQTAIQTETISRFAVEDLKLKTCAFIGRNDAWSRSAADEFKKRLKNQGGKVILTELFELGTTDFYPQLTKVKNANPDFIYFCALAEDGSMAVKQARELGITCPLMGTDDMANEQAFRVAGNAAEGLYCFWVQGPKTDRSIAYEKSYKEKYGIESTPVDKGGYDAMGIVAAAIEQAGTVTDGEKIRDALAKTDYQGTRQRFSFAPSGQAKIEMWMIHVEKMKVKFIKRVHIYENPSAPL